MLEVKKNRKTDYQGKVIFLGNSGVGKSHLIHTWCHSQIKEQFSTTIGVDSRKKTYKIDDKAIQLCYWDTAGQERFRTVTTSYFRNVDAAIFVYSIIDASSLSGIETWFNESVGQKCEDAIKIILANKIDLEIERKVSKSEGKQLVDKLQKKYRTNIFFFETSALTGNNQEQIVQMLVKNIYNKKKKENPLGKRPIYLSADSSEYEKEKKKKCQC